jgi:hypothetical protein
MKVTVTPFFSLDRFGYGFCGVCVLCHCLSPSKKIFYEDARGQEILTTRKKLLDLGYTVCGIAHPG